MNAFLGIDTSNYTTSAALYSPETGEVRDSRTPLSVPAGFIGLRQSDALFQHLKALPDVLLRLNLEKSPCRIAAVGASVRPREAEGSYMPCFLAGESAARSISAALNAPFYSFSHQQGHLAAAALLARRPDVLSVPFIGLHISGGTTEILYVCPDELEIPNAKVIGGSSDLSAGQLIDRTGNRLSLRFPAGKELDRLSLKAEKKLSFTPKADNLYFSLSGLENKVSGLLDAGEGAEDIAYFVIKSIETALVRAVREALKLYGELPVLISGGVASNTMIRRRFSEEFSAIIGSPESLSDNAVGAAYLASVYHCKQNSQRR